MDIKKADQKLLEMWGVYRENVDALLHNIPLSIVRELGYDNFSEQDIIEMLGDAEATITTMEEFIQEHMTRVMMNALADCMSNLWEIAEKTEEEIKKKRGGRLNDDDKRIKTL